MLNMSLQPNPWACLDISSPIRAVFSTTRAWLKAPDEPLSQRKHYTYKEASPVRHEPEFYPIRKQLFYEACSGGPDFLHMVFTLPCTPRPPSMHATMLCTPYIDENTIIAAPVVSDLISGRSQPNSQSSRLLNQPHHHINQHEQDLHLSCKFSNSTSFHSSILNISSIPRTEIWFGRSYT